jgi:hypothetical protein
MLRFNHMEITLPDGDLTKYREELKQFYGEVFGFESLDVPILKQTGLLLRTDPDTSQFLLITEQTKHLSAPGYDHLGFLYETRAEVDALREKVGKLQERDPRIEIKDYDDLVTGPVTVRAFYVRFLLPLWFDVQCIETEPGSEPARRWNFS